MNIALHLLSTIAYVSLLFAWHCPKCPQSIFANLLATSPDIPMPLSLLHLCCAQTALSLCPERYLLISSRSISNIPFCVQPEVSHFLCWEWINEWINNQLPNTCWALKNMQSHHLLILQEHLFLSFYRWGHWVLEMISDFSPKLQSC